MSKDKVDIQFEQKDKKLNGKFVVMPPVFFGVRKSSGSTGKIIFIVALTALVLVIIALIVFFVRTVTTKPTVPAPQLTEKLSVIEPELKEEPVVKEEKTTEELKLEDTILNDIVIPPLSLGGVQTATDTDQDGLTDIEEQIFATSASVPDTDSDSFLDGNEVANLYDPTLPSTLLEVSPQIKIARNEKQGYQFLMPSAWSSTINTPRGEELFIRTDGSETLKINVYENTDRLTVSEWYQKNSDIVNFTQFSNFSNEAGWSGIQSNDGQLVIATFGEDGAGARAFIFVLYYDLGDQETFRFPSIWKMILNSLAILEPEESTRATDAL